MKWFDDRHEETDSLKINPDRHYVLKIGIKHPHTDRNHT